MLSREDNREAAEVLQRQADAARKLGELTSAEAFYRQLIEMGKLSEWAWFSLGQISQMRQMPEEALEHFSRAIQVSPEFFWSHYELLATAMQIGAVPSKLSAAADGVAGSLPPGFREVHCAIVEAAAVQLWDAQFYPQAVRLLEWIAASPHLEPLSLVRIIERSSNLDLVGTATERLMARDPSTLESHVLRVLSNHMRSIGNRDAELRLLRQYWQSSPNDFAAFLSLGRRLAQTGPRANWPNFGLRALASRCGSAPLPRSSSWWRRVSPYSPSSGSGGTPVCMTRCRCTLPSALPMLWPRCATRLRWSR